MIIVFIVIVTFPLTGLALFQLLDTFWFEL
jgi:hypothetical protein